jgi:hypothetical protein
MKYSICTLAPAHMPKMSFGRGPALALGDEVDPVLLDVERLVRLGVVNDR